MRNSKKVITLFLAVMVSTLTACGSANVYEGHQSGYTIEDSVVGVAFDAPDSLIEEATAVTAITDDMAEGSWLYKNGVDSYIAYNMSDCVVMVQAGTDFHFEDSKKIKDTLLSKGVNSVYFSEVDRKLNYTTSKKNDAYKIVMDVNANVSITPDIFGVFTGKLACVTDGVTEYTLFVGVPGNTQREMSKSLLDTMSHIAASFSLTGESLVSNEPTEVEEEKSEEKVEELVTSEPAPVIEEVVEEPTEEVSEDENAPAEEGANEGTKEDTKENTKEDAKEGAASSEDKETAAEKKNEKASAKEEKSEADSTKQTANTSDNTNKTTDNASSEPSKTQINQNTNTTVVTKSISASMGSNQKKRKVQSSLYSMASIGDTTFVQADTFAEEMPLTEGTVTITNRLTGKDAISFIKKAYKDKALLGKYQEAPTGTSYEVVEFTTSIDPEVGYIDTRIEGLDGNNLKFQGVEYKKNTYDILGYVSKSKDGRYEKCYCFYAVPNGCKEYLLEMGSFVEQVRDKNAYFDIRRTN